MTANFDPVSTPSAKKDMAVATAECRLPGQANPLLRRYAITGQGDAKTFQGRNGERLRIGGYLMIYHSDADG